MNLVQHPLTRQQLSGLVANPGGSLLLHGPAGVGKRTAALDVARQLNCVGCTDNSCRSCRMALAGNHPDITLLQPDEKGKIGIEAIQQLDHQLHYRQFEVASRRVVIIARGETMTISAQNALLKLLEEPPVGCTVMITAVSPVSLLETIASRCRPLYVAPLSDQQISELLTQQYGVSKNNADQMAAMSFGAVGRAIRLATSQEEFDSYQEMTREVNELLSAPRLFERLLTAGRIAGQSANLMAYLEIFTQQVRRAVRQNDRVANLAAVERLRRRISANVSAKVALEALAVEVVC